MAVSATEEIYSSGSCHIFAAACILAHGGEFLVATDAGSPHYETDDGDVDEVIHVLAILSAPDGSEVIRDVFGDRPDSPTEGWTALRQEISARYQVWERDIVLTRMNANEMSEIVQDDEGFFRAVTGGDDQYALIPDHDDRPLGPMFEADMAEASAWSR